MSETHKINEIIKKIDRKVLEALFQKLALPALEETWKTFSTRKPEPLYAALAKLEPAHLQVLGEALEEIASVGEEPRNIRDIRALLSEYKVELPAEISDFTAPTLAAWCYATRGTIFWNKVLARAELNAKKLSDWASFDLKFNAEPARGLITARAAALERVAMDFFQHYEYRGYHCKSECYSVEETETIVFYLTDHKENLTLWLDETKGYRTFNGSPIFKVVLSFDYDLARLGLLYDGSTLNRGILAENLANALFGANAYSRMEAVKYTLQKWKLAWELTLPPNLPELRRAVIVGLELRLNTKSRRTYVEKEADLQAAIRTEIGEDRLRSPNTLVTRAHLRLTYDSPHRKNATRLFRISETAIAGFNTTSREVQKMLRAFLNYHNICRTNNDVAN